jgi:hypothetical protein
LADSAISPRPPGSTPQDVCTPQELIIAVKRILGNLVVDWAASKANVCETWFGQNPDTWYEHVTAKGDVVMKNDDPGSLDLDWSIYHILKETDNDYAWLNPPFSGSKIFLRKCAIEIEFNKVHTIALVQTATGSVYWKEVVWFNPCAYVVHLMPRVPFEGYGNGANIDTSLIVWSTVPLDEKNSKVFIWNWRDPEGKLEAV